VLPERRLLTVRQRELVDAAVAQPGLSMADLGRAAGYPDPWSGAHYQRVRALECYGWVTVEKDYGRPHAPCLVWPTDAAVALVEGEAAA
jgi:predicted transcriptional regulator